MSSAAPRLRVRISRDARDETRALARSVLAHLALLLAIVVVDWLHRVTWSRPEAIRVGLAPALPQQARAPVPPPPRPRPTVATAPPATAPPVETAPPEEEPPQGLAPPIEATAPPRPKPKPPRPSAPPATAPAPASSEPAPAPSAPAYASAGMEASVEGWEGGPGDPYLAGIVRRVSSRWSKPTSGLPATPAIVTFVIERSGAVSDARLETSSGSSLYDRAAQRAIDLASPMPPLPAGVRGDRLTVHFRFLP